MTNPNHTDQLAQQRALQTLSDQIAKALDLRDPWGRYPHVRVVRGDRLNHRHAANPVFNRPPAGMRVQGQWNGGVIKIADDAHDRVETLLHELAHVGSGMEHGEAFRREHERVLQVFAETEVEA